MVVGLKFRIMPRAELNEIMGAVKVMERKAANWLIANKKTALGSVSRALYHQFRAQFPHLHSLWVTGSLRAATAIVHAFNKRKRKGKCKRPNLTKPFITLNKGLFRVSWNGRILHITIFKTPRDLEPMHFFFIPRGRYVKFLNMWREGKCEMGEITLTPTSISIPIKLPDVPPYEPKTVIGIDSNENSLDLFIAGDGTLKSIDISDISKINRDHDKRIRKGTKGKNNPKAKKKIQSKHGRIRREKTKSRWGKIAVFLIALALKNQAALVLENLKGLKQNISLRHASKRLRQRLLNYWSIMLFHNMLTAKAKEYGVPIVFIEPAGTSQSCPICGGNLRGQDEECRLCGLSRHYAAAINIARRGLEKFPSLSGLGQGSVCDPRRPSSDDTVGGRRCVITTGIPSSQSANSAAVTKMHQQQPSEQCAQPWVVKPATQRAACTAEKRENQ